MLRNHLETARKQILGLVNELEPRVLRFMLRIEEDQTFRIDQDNIARALDKLNIKQKA